MSDYILQASGICKSYRLAHTTLPILNGADLSIAPQETISIIGKSGSGKSTLMHILGGLDAPDSGSVTISGQNLYKISDRKRTRIRSEKIGFVFQQYHLLPELDVLENVCSPAWAYDTLKDPKSRAKELLSRVGLSARLNHRPSELSGGECQRVAIARALLLSPALIIADEPTGNLDKETGNTLLRLLLDVINDEGRALLIVTHDPIVASHTARTLKLENGRLITNMETP